MITKPIVEVWWHDAEGHNEWESEDGEHSPPKVRTVGHLISHTKLRIVIAHTHSEKEINGRFVIPAGMIISVTELKPGGENVDVYSNVGGQSE